MARTAHKSKPKRKAAPQATLAHTLAPEEIRPRDTVAVLYEIVEFPSWYWCEESVLASRSETVLIRYVPREDPIPMRVRSVCLPYVLIEQPCGSQRTLDIRRCRLARLHATHATSAWKAYRKAAKKRLGEQNSELAKK